ncbi:MAG: hypothetical protein H6868_03290 [Rhodospirillales bacterium]|nr:hypothetical protein [Rhodospirillales bacterium]
MNDLDKYERKKEKKIGRIMRNSVLVLGIGIGLFLLKFLVVPFLGDNEQGERVLVIFSLSLMGYGVINVLTFMFLKDGLFKVNLLMTWVVLPLVLLKLVMDFV